VHLIGFIIRK